MINKSILIYSNDRDIHDYISMVIGKQYYITSIFTGEYLNYYLFQEKHSIDLIILDGESSPGGFCISYDLRIHDRDDKILCLIKRNDDLWLSDWSRCDYVMKYPMDMYELITGLNKIFI